MNRPVRVGVLVSTLVVGGAEQLLRDLLERMDPGVVAPDLLFLKDDPGRVGEELLQEGFPSLLGIMPRKCDPTAPFRLSRILRERRVDVLLLINHFNTLLYGVLAAKLAGVPCVNWHNETNKPYRLHALTQFCRRLAHRGVDVIAAAAKGHGEYIKKIERLPGEDVRVVYNAVDPARAASDLSKAEARTRLDVPQDAKVVVQVAALRPDKAHQVMLRALAEVLKDVPEAVLLVAGDGPERPALETLAAELGLGGHCRFLGVRRDIGNVLAAADVMALSSNPQQETLSVAAIEAMFAGLPVVCTRVGFMDEIILQGETGFLVPHQDPHALALALENILINDAARERMGRAALKLVTELCHVDVMARSFEGVFVDMAGRRLRRRPPAAQGNF